MEQPKRVHERAPAKVNLLLRIVGRRPDGYHLLVSILSTLELADELVARRLSDGPPGLLRVSVQGPGAARLEATGTPRVEEVFLTDGRAAASPNLVVRAAAALARWAERCEPVPAVPVAPAGTRQPELALARSPGAVPPTELVLTKRIPAGAGMGGGSSDAAATLRALARLWGVQCSPQALEAIGAGLGADVPFFVRGGVQLAEGIGERLSPLTSRCRAWYVLAVPEAVISTREAYRVWDRLAAQMARPEGDPNAGSEADRQALAEARAMAEALARGDLDGVAARVRNDLEPAAFTLYPPLADVVAALRRSGLVGVSVSGSGPAAFGLARSADEARQALRWLESWRAGQAFALELFAGRL